MVEVADVVREVDELVVDDDVVDVADEVEEDAVVEELVVVEVVEVEVVEVELIEGAKFAVSVPAPFATRVVEAADRFARAMAPELAAHPEKL